jgi:hypothetical protein
VENVNKQDDGAARRIFHTNALKAMLSWEDPDKPSIRPGFEGVFAYLFILGKSLAFKLYISHSFTYSRNFLWFSRSLFEAWINPNMKTEDRVMATLRARFWLHLWYRHILHLSEVLPDLYSLSRSFISPASFQILNHLCDTLVLLVLAFSRYYPTIPFCIWLFGTEFFEHFFGIARQLLPNVSYAEFLKMVQHIMVRQRILESGLLKVRQEHESATGYIFNSGADTRKAAPGLIVPADCPARLSDHKLNE